MRWPRQKSLEKFKEAIRQKTQRTRSGSMQQIIEETNRTLRGWFNYFQHSIANIFGGLDTYPMRHVFAPPSPAATVSLRE